MHTLPLDAKDEDVFRLVHAWVELLAQEKYVEAFDMLHPQQGWTAEIMRALIVNYGSLEPMEDGRTFRVTSLGENPSLEKRDEWPYQDVWWLDKDNGEQGGSGNWVHFTLPLDGEWGELTAVFELVEVNQRLALEVCMIKVL